MYTIHKASLVFSIFAISSIAAQAQIKFENATSAAKLSNVGETWGSSWGDFNGDGRPDILVNNHRDRPSLYRNNGDNTFTDVVITSDQSRTWLGDPLGDTHGGAWLDIDSDGDKDLIVATGSFIPPQLFTNENGLLTNETDAFGIPDDGGGRMIAGFDYNNDARIDLATMNSGTSKILKQKSDGTFAKVNQTVGFNCNGFRSNYAQLSDIDNDVSIGGSLEFFCMRDGTSPAKVFDISTQPFTNISNSVPTTANVVDTVFADFDRNLSPDMFMVRGALRPSQTLLINPNKIETLLSVNENSNEKGFIFNSSGVINVDVNTRNYDPPRIFIGAAGTHPATLEFTLDSNDSGTWGLAPHNPGSDLGLYIGYDTVSGQWQFQLSSGGENANTYFVVDTQAAVTNLEIIGQQIADLPIAPRLFMNYSGVFEDETNARGLNSLLSCVHVVAGDFDNDMDEDLYMVCRGGVENLRNRLFKNKGDGTFTEVVFAGGARGAVGKGLDSGVGTGESVTTADYDLDGFLDLLVLNGLNLQPIHVGGPDQLFRNMGNSNHWIQLDLVGTVSHIDAIGSKVHATAGGITQLREKNGSFHRWSQNDQRLHFGLASNNRVNLTVYWPNGVSDTFVNVVADKIYRVTQGSPVSGPSTIEEIEFGPVPGFPALTAADVCGEPLFNPFLDRVLMLWKDCVNNVWNLKAMSGGSLVNETYSGKLVSNLPFTSVTTDELEVGDVVDNLNNPLTIDYKLTMKQRGEDGFQFTFSDESTVCFQADGLPEGAQVLIGSRHLPVTEPLNLTTLESCNLSALVPILFMLLEE